MPGKIIIIGKRFGKLIVIADWEPQVGPDGRRALRSLCLCDCGKLVVVSNNNLRWGGVPNRLSPEPAQFVYECDCTCPNCGKEPPEGISVVRGEDCGHEMNVCNLCLVEGRITECRKCSGGLAA